MEFKPPSRDYVDYFIRMSSTVKGSTMFHDSNGYLVSKREVNKRPDYEW